MIDVYNYWRVLKGRHKVFQLLGSLFPGKRNDFTEKEVYNNK